MDEAERTLTLMNQETPVLRARYDAELHVFTRIVGIIAPEFAPPALFDGTGTITRRTLNAWWRARTIPASRDQMDEIAERLHRLNIDGCLDLLERSFGLSLSDRYWVSDDSLGLAWRDINFFDNDFTDDLGLITFDGSSPAAPNLCSPDSSLGGDLRKKWIIRDGERVLMKSGAGALAQEPYNELVATRLFERMLPADGFVPYALEGRTGDPRCTCPNMLGTDEELVTAWDLICNRKKPNNENDWQFLVRTFESLGADDARARLTDMFVLDLVIANRDRHYRNFGLIRDVKTLAYKRCAPIFDTGGSLWCWARELDVPRDFAYRAKPFGAEGYPFDRQLRFFDQLDWFDESRLEGFSDEVAEVLAANPMLSSERIDKIRRQIDRNIEQIAIHRDLAGTKRVRKRLG